MEIYLPTSTYYALVSDLSAILTPNANPYTRPDPDQRAVAVAKALHAAGVFSPSLVTALTEAKSWFVPFFDPDQVKMILGEEGGIWPESLLKFENAA